jgi:hypothetical protein
MNSTTVAKLALGFAILSSFSTNGCLEETSTSSDAPAADLNGGEAAAIYSRGDRTITANKPRYSVLGTVSATITIGSQAGSATTSNGSCLLTRYANEAECDNEGASDYVANNCPSLPGGWNSPKYCLTADGSNKKHCYARPGAPIDYCVGAPVYNSTGGAQGTLKLAVGTHSLPSASAFVSGKTAAHWINYACIDGCGGSVYAPGSRSPDLSAAEFSGDGKPDVLVYKPVTGSTGDLKVNTADAISGYYFLQNGGTTVKSWTASSKIVSPGDFDGDYISDILEFTSTGDLLLWAGTGGGAVAATSSTVMTGLSTSSSFYGVGDFDLDGRNDLIGVASGGGMTLYTGNGAGGILSTYSIGTAPTGTFVPVGDVTGDGKPDVMSVATSNPNQPLYVCVGSGTATGGFTSCNYTGYYGWNSFDPFIGGTDFNGDGLPDFFARNTSTGQLWLYPGNGSGNLTGTSFQVESGWNTFGQIRSVF